MASPPRSATLLAALAVAVAMTAAGVAGDFAADRAECSDKLAGLATCLTFVQEQATAAAPTPDCCAGLRTVLQTSRKCLCVLVKDKDDPSLGLKLNVTRALALPSVCKAAANVSDCPRLLSLPPNSKDALVFEQYAKQMGSGAQAARTAPGGAGSTAATATAAQKSGAARWVGVSGGALAAAISAVFSALAVPFLLLLG